MYTFRMGRQLRTASVPALEKGLAVLEHMARSRRGLTLPEISRRSGLPKSTVHQLVLTFERCGYVRRSGLSARLVLDVKLLMLGSAALRGLKLREQAQPFLRELSQQTGLTVHMAILGRDDAVLVEKLEAPGAFRVATWVGRRMDLHSTGVGKALMAHVPEPEIDRLIREHGISRHNENTIYLPGRLKAELEKVRRIFPLRSLSK